MAEENYPTQEEWRPVVGYENAYHVSNIGRVKRVLDTKYTSSGNVLSPASQKSGHLFVLLSLNGKARPHRVHRLVLIAFIGPCPEGMMCRHLDGNPKNNRLENLQWGTMKENQADRIIHGTAIRGEKSKMAKITAEIVIEMRRIRRESNWTYQRIADHFGVTRKTAERAIKGECWGHV